MILQALQSHYQRERQQPDTTIPPEGFEYLDMHCIIHLDLQGDCTGFEFKDSDEGGIFMSVPKDVDRSSNVAANFLWDNLEYVLGFTKGDKEKNAEKAQDRQKAFLQRVQDAYRATELNELKAISTFLENEPLGEIEKYQDWQQVLESKKLSFRATFSFANGGYIVEFPKIIEYVQKCWDEEKDASQKSVCLISGQKAAAASFHPKIKGFPKMGTGIKLISFDNETFFSHSRQGSDNAPVSMEAAFQYATALTHLLRRGSKQKRTINDLTFLFWAAEKGKNVDNIQEYLATGELSKDDPERRNDIINNWLNAPQSGNLQTADSDDLKVKFYVLGLTAPNKGRLAVRYWMRANIAEVGTNIAHHLQDIALQRQDGSKYYAADWQLLSDMRDLNRKKKDDAVYTTATIALWESVLEGVAYPKLVFRKIVERCCKEQARRDEKTRRALPNVTESRAAFIKGYLLRLNRQNETKEDFLMKWEKDIPNPAYGLGGMFALYERLQKASRQTETGHKESDTSPGMRDRYFATACRRPGIILPKLEQKVTPYYRKLKRKGSYGLATWYEREIGELSKKIAAFGKPWPMLSSLEEQGWFIMGYHQKLHDNSGKESDTPPEGEKDDE